MTATRFQPVLSSDRGEPSLTFGRSQHLLRPHKSPALFSIWSAQGSRLLIPPPAVLLRISAVPRPEGEGCGNDTIEPSSQLSADGVYCEPQRLPLRR